MPVHLLDVNVLMALAWPRHAHHLPLSEWFKSHEAEGFATCPFTQAGFVRISSNPVVIPKAKSPARALELLNGIIARMNHVFWPDDLMMTDSKFIATDRLRGHGQVTDAYLLGLALHHNGR